MKKIYKSFIAGLLFLLPLISQAQQRDWCLSEILFQEKAKQDPTLLQIREKLDRETEAYIASHPNQKTSSVVKIIPVVFHVIHEGGPENISKAQILSQLDVMNQCYRRLNADTTDTPAPFKPLAADVQVEFRLAQLDPNGNCTDGITRTFSHLTNDARENVKALIDWPRDKYLNIWTVKTIENTGSLGGITVGYAQFPGGGAATDGIEMNSSFIGTVGTGANSGNGGRALVHEVGHFLNLYHIWGDDNGACTGSDQVTDTPNQADLNFTTCPTFPMTDACTPTGNGIMFMDYMDYTKGTCMNMFSVGQAARMNAALNSSVSSRNNLWSSANLIATGTDGTPPVTCVPIADFNTELRYICEGTTVNFVDNSWNGDPSSWAWSFPGGTPDTSNLQNPSVQYSTAGVYDVSLTVTNSAGNDTKTGTGMIVVSPAAAAVGSVPYQEGFESIIIPGSDWFISNDAGNSWEQTTVAAHTGTKSMRINNYTGNPTGSVDGLVTTSFDLSNVTNTSMIFWRAFAYRSNTSTDALRIYASTNCGQLWSLRYNKTGTALGTAGLLSSNFIPTAAQWDADTVNLSSTSVSTKPNVRFKFEYTQSSGNNIYIDDINLNGTVGINEINGQQVNFNIYPNPAQSKSHVVFTLKEKNNVLLKIYDFTGRIVSSMEEKNLQAGEYQYDVDASLASGVYYVNLTVGDKSSVKKLVIN